MAVLTAMTWCYFFMNCRCAPREVSIRLSRAEQRGLFKIMWMDYHSIGSVTYL